MKLSLSSRHVAAILVLVLPASVDAVSSFGTFTRGSDLEPTSVFLTDGGAGSGSATINFSTFRAEVGFDPASVYLPVLRAESAGEDATFDDDRTQAEAHGYQSFTSSLAQTIKIDITLDSIVTNASEGTSSVLSNIYVLGGSDFSISDTFCSGEFMFAGTYMCGNRIAQSSHGLNFSNLSNGGSSPLLTDFLLFDVAASGSFGIYAELLAGSFKGTADAFNTLRFAFNEDETGNVGAIAAIEVPSPVPLPGAAWLFGAALAGLFGFLRRGRQLDG